MVNYNVKNVKYVLILMGCISSLVFYNQGYGQTSVTGIILDEDGSPVPYANVIIKSDTSSSATILSFSHSNELGKYSININNSGIFNLSFSALAYETKQIPIEILPDQYELEQNVVLPSKSFELNEVIVHAAKPITIKGDTIVFDAKSFSKGNEEVVEDLLKNIPGLEVDDEGGIRVSGKTVDKVMVQGDDFFEKGYKILTKNMPSDPIDKIEVLQNYSDNRLLKNIESSDRVALNLTLKEDAKREWFGNVEAGYDVTFNKRHNIKSNLLNFGIKNKFYFLSNLNNIGNDATGDINELIRPIRLDEPANIGEGQKANALVNLSAFPPNFKKKRIHFNDDKLLSLNTILNPHQNLKIKALSFINFDKTNFFRNSINSFNAQETNFTNTENYQLQNRNNTYFGKFDLTYNISKSQMLEMTTKYNMGSRQSHSDLLFNNDLTFENLEEDNELFDQKIIFTSKLKKNKVLLLSGRFIKEQLPQKYSINQFFYQDLFPANNANNVEQVSQTNMQFSGFEAHYLDRKKNGNLLEFQFGDQLKQDQLQSVFILKDDDTNINEPSDYRNNLNYITNDLYFKTKYELSLNNISVIGKLKFHQLYNQLKAGESSKEQRPFFVNPSLGIKWKLNDNNNFFTSYSFNTANATITDLYDHNVLTGFRTFTRGTNRFNQLDASTFLFNYQLGDWGSEYFVNVLVFYNNNHDFYSTNTMLSQNYALSQAVAIKNRQILNVTSELNKYFSKISTTLKIKAGVSKSDYKNIVNESGFREIELTNYNYGIELRSGYMGFFNYHIGSSWKTNRIHLANANNSYTDNLTFLDLSFVMNKKLDFGLQSEVYYFGNIDQGSNRFYFIDMNTRYTIKKNKLSVTISGKNLFNTRSFTNYSINDTGFSATEYRLLPRYLLLSLKFRF